MIGAGAAGMKCAIEADKRGRTVLLLDHVNKFAEKSAFPVRPYRGDFYLAEAPPSLRYLLALFFNHSAIHSVVQSTF